MDTDGDSVFSPVIVINKEILSLTILYFQEKGLWYLFKEKLFCLQLFHQLNKTLFIPISLSF